MKKRDQFTDNSPTEEGSNWTNVLFMKAILMNYNYMSENLLSCVSWLCDSHIKGREQKGD